MIQKFLQLERSWVSGGVVSKAGVLAAAAVFAFGSVNSIAQEAEPEMTEEEAEQAYLEVIEEIGWKREGTGDVGQWAEVEIPSGFRFADGNGARQLLQIWGNIPGSQEQGVIANEGADWAIFFDFDETGYVKDDDKDDLKPDKLLKEKRKLQEQANEYIRQQGGEPLELVGWAKEPYYNEETNNLEWGIILESESGQRSINYNAKLLGRNGVMDATLVCSPDEVEELMPTYRSILAGFGYKEGKAYGDYKEGDKIAKYGLTALVVGGGAAVAAKLGFFAVIGKFIGKLGKLIIIPIVALGVGIKKFFSRGSGRIEE